MLAWLRVCRPPELGGLGILDLVRFGFALRMRWLWLRKTDPSRPWHCLPDEKEPLVESLFQASIYIELGDGCTALFWSDRWLEGQSLPDVAPCLCNAVGTRVRSKRTVAQAPLNGQWIRDISGALTVQVLLEYMQIWEKLQNVHLQNQPDRICWKWTPDRTFTTASAYRAFFFGQHPIVGAKLLHRSRAPPKCKFFIWLALHDRCWTAHRRKKRNLQDNDSCILCNQSPETIDHLLVGCPFSRELWYKIFLRLGWQRLTPDANVVSLADWWETARKSISKPDRKSFDSMVILTCWHLWKERNKRTFDKKEATTDVLLSYVSDEVVCWCQAGLGHLKLVAVAFGSSAGRELASP